MVLQKDTIRGVINSEVIVTASVITSESVTGSLSAPIIKCNSEYIATPKTTEQVLKTEDRYMNGNVIIKPIPFYTVDNINNGQTVHIGDE